MPLVNGAHAAGFRIVRLLGSGGMGEVYLAEHPRLPRRDALKILPRGVSADPGFRERFNRESDLAAGLWHPHIVGVHDRGEFAGQLWLSMDYVEGADAARLLCEKCPTGMPPKLVVEIVAAIADALDYAHDRGLLHRDVKPANILISQVPHGTQHRIVLTDFGVARLIDDANGLTETNMTVGTVSYIAPEQLLAGPIDGRADQYALAATAFHLLTGSPPFTDDNPAVVITKHLNAPPPRLGDIRLDLAGYDEPFARALAKRSTDRFERCGDFAAALQCCKDPARGSRRGRTAGNSVASVADAVRAEPAPAATSDPAQASPRRTVWKSMAVVSAIVGVFAVGFLVLMALGLPRERSPAPPNIDVPSSALTSPPAPAPPPVASTVQPAETSPVASSAPESPETTQPPSTTTASTPATSTWATTTTQSWPPTSTTAVTGAGSRPAVGAACSASQVGMTAISNTNMPVQCVRTPNGFIWMSGGAGS